MNGVMDNSSTWRLNQMKKISIKQLPFDIFQEMLKDEGISQQEKTILIKERGDKRFKDAK